MFICGLINSTEPLIVETLNMIIGILNIIIIELPKAMFLLFSKFIAPDIEANEVKINELIINISKIRYIFSKLLPNKRHAMGIIIIKGNWKKNQRQSNFIITIISYDNPLKCKR